MTGFMLTQTKIQADLDILANTHAAISDAISVVGYPAERRQPQGFETFASIIIGQQVSTSAALAITNRVKAVVGGELNAGAIDRVSDEKLRAAGLSPQKLSYIRSLSQAVVTQELVVEDLPAMSDDEVVRTITAVKGFGEWSAHMYLMFSLGRPDVWPTGDLAIRVGFGRMFGLAERPTPNQIRLAAEPLKPYRSAVSLLCWRYYGYIRSQR